MFCFAQKEYSEDAIYRYMDKLYNTQKELVQKISYQHTLKVLLQGIQVVFYDVTTIYFQTDYEDDLRKTGFSKEGKHQNPQIVLGLLVSEGGYPMAYEIFEGNQYEGHTMLPIINGFKAQYKIDNLIVVADSGLLSKTNIEELIANNYEFILGQESKMKNKKYKIKYLLIEILQSIYEIEVITPKLKEKITKTLLLTKEQKLLSEVFDFRC